MPNPTSNQIERNTSNQIERNTIKDNIIKDKKRNIMQLRAK